MSRRTALLLLVLTTLVVASPSLAHDANGSGEDQQVQRSCGAAADPHYSPPTSTDCRDAEGNFDASKSYTSTYYSNDVRCGSTNQVTPSQANATGLRVYGGVNPTAQTAGAGVCSDGSGPASVLQGRITYTGGISSGSRIAVDGDKDNEESTTQGYIVITKASGASAPTYSCGDEHGAGGRADSDHPTSGDTSADCQG